MLLHHSLLIFSAFAAASVPAEAQRRGEMPSEEGTRHALEGYLAKHFTVADIDAARNARSSIMALGAYGEFATFVPRGILVRERSGWATRSGGQSQPLPSDVSRRIDQILADPKFWSEASYDPRQLCTGGARLMTVRHAGRLKTTRQSCGPAGIVGALAEIAVSGRVPAGLAPPQAESVRRPIVSDDERVHPTQEPEVSRIVWSSLERAAWAWDRGDLEGFTAPYAEDVMVVWPTGIEYHKPALKNRALAAQAWNGRPARLMKVIGASIRQLAPYRVLQSYLVRYSGGGRPESQMWVTALWENRRGTWEITYEHPGPETPVHGR